MIKKCITLIFILFFIGKICLGIIVNPSAAYCNALGYNYKTKMVEEGEMGICEFPDGSSCEAWNFLEGKCGEEYSYCTQQGYEIKTINDTEKCSSIFSNECAVCILNNGTEIEVTKLMELNFDVGECGDNTCMIGENYKNCPEDCPSGSPDFYCDGIKDGICDPDCEKNADPDCITTTTLSTTTTTIPGEKPSKIIWYIIVGIIIVILVFFFIYQMRNQPQQPQQISY